MKRLIFKRRKQGITDYKKRLALLKSGKPRLVIRKTNANVVVQITEYNPKGDKVVASMDIRNLRAKGWKAGASTPAAYLIGYMAGKLAKERKVKEAVLDIGRHPVSSKLFAALKGAIDAGLKVPHDSSVFPSEERINGAHIDGYLSKAEGHQFSKYKRDKVKVQSEFERILKEIKGE